MTHQIGKNTLGFILVYCLLSKITDGLSSLYTHILTHLTRKKTESSGWPFCCILKDSEWRSDAVFWSLPSKPGTFPEKTQKAHQTPVLWLKHYTGWPVINNARFTHFTGLLRKISPGTLIYSSPKCLDQLICIVYSWILIRVKTDVLYDNIMRE